MKYIINLFLLCLAVSLTMQAAQREKWFYNASDVPLKVTETDLQEKRMRRQYHDPSVLYPYTQYAIASQGKPVPFTLQFRSAQAELTVWPEGSDAQDLSIKSLTSSLRADEPYVIVFENDPDSKKKKISARAMAKKQFDEQFKKKTEAAEEQKAKSDAPAQEGKAS